MSQDISHMNIQVNTGDTTNNNNGGDRQGGARPPQVSATYSRRGASDETGSYMAPDAGPAWSGEVNYTPAAPEEVMVGGGPVSYDPSLRSDYAQSQRMRNPIDMEATMNPSDSRESYRASLRSLLDRNVGFFVVASFLMGNSQSVTWQGILHTVGSDYFVLYQPDYDRYISCDLYSVKFIQFHNIKGVPYCASSRTWEGNSTW